MAVQIKSDTLLALAIVAYRLDDKAVSAYGDKVQDAMKLGPTIFPIAFAAIASKAVRSLARKLVERGEKIGVSLHGAPVMADGVGQVALDH